MPVRVADPKVTNDRRKRRRWQHVHQHERNRGDACDCQHTKHGYQQKPDDTGYVQKALVGVGKTLQSQSDRGVSPSNDRVRNKRRRQSSGKSSRPVHPI